MNEEIKKYWLKSKTVIFNGAIAVTSFLSYMIDTYGKLANDNLEWIKSSVPTKWVFVVLGVVGIYNIFLRFKANTAITSKKSEVTDVNNNNPL